MNTVKKTACNARRIVAWRRALAAMLTSGCLWALPVVGADPTTIYFTYDSAVVAPKFLSAIREHAARLQANPDQTLLLEGHTDRRGSREYNLRLGEHRVQAVLTLLLQYGARAEQVEMISFGEEILIDAAGDAHNRRVTLAYR